MSELEPGVEISYFDDDPPVVAAGFLDGKPFVLSWWTQRWSFKVVEAKTINEVLNADAKFIFVESSPADNLFDRPSDRTVLVKSIKELVLQCSRNYRSRMKEKAGSA